MCIKTMAIEGNFNERPHINEDDKRNKRSRVSKRADSDKKARAEIGLRKG
jgi:hypothetical protein